MKYAVIFVPATARYSCHALNCSAGQTKVGGKGYTQQRAPLEFDSIAEARAWADQDEYEKRSDDKPKKGCAIWRVCGCTKPLSLDSITVELRDEPDPTPWCQGCGAMKRKGCFCGPLADND